MRLLFFDMEFANGQVPGSIYSLGYTVTDEAFRVLVPPTDLLINPDAKWNAYVQENILAYSKEDVEAAPKFSELYPTVKALFEDADLAVGFALNNDTRELKRDCKRYGLEPLRFRTFDTEKLCRLTDANRDAHGLAGCVKAWCGEAPDNQHRSDGDALATMHLFRAICQATHATPEMMLLAYPECVGNSITSPKPTKRGASPKKKRNRPHGGKKTPPKSEIAGSVTN